MAPDPAGRDEAWLAAPTGRRPAPRLPPAYFLGLVLVSAAMVVLPRLERRTLGSPGPRRVVTNFVVY